MKRAWFSILALVAAAHAADPAVFSFPSPAEEARFQHLTSELRCLVCQNQSLADSHADLAGDLRREIYAMLTQGKTDAEIIDFLVQRYGNFVRYRPPVTGATLGLWFAPLLLLLVGSVLLVKGLRRRQRLPPPALSPEARRRAAELLEGELGAHADGRQ